MNENDCREAAVIDIGSHRKYRAPASQKQATRLPPYGVDAVNNPHPQAGSIVMCGRDGWRAAYFRNTIEGIQGRVAGSSRSGPG